MTHIMDDMLLMMKRKRKLKNNKYNKDKSQVNYIINFYMRITLLSSHIFQSGHQKARDKKHILLLIQVLSTIIIEAQVIDDSDKEHSSSSSLSPFSLSFYLCPLSLSLSLTSHLLVLFFYPLHINHYHNEVYAKPFFLQYLCYYFSLAALYLAICIRCVPSLALSQFLSVS